MPGTAVDTRNKAVNETSPALMKHVCQQGKTRASGIKRHKTKPGVWSQGPDLAFETRAFGSHPSLTAWMTWPHPLFISQPVFSFPQ